MKPNPPHYTNYSDCTHQPLPNLADRIVKKKDLFLFSLGQSRAKVLVSRFGPKINTKIAFNTTKVNVLTNSRLKFSYNTRPN